MVDNQSWVAILGNAGSIVSAAIALIMLVLALRRRDKISEVLNIGDKIKQVLASNAEINQKLTAGRDIFQAQPTLQTGGTTIVAKDVLVMLPQTDSTMVPSEQASGQAEPESSNL